MKRSSRKKRLAKWSKLGLSLAAVTVLGGLVEPVGFKVVGSTEVYAEETTGITYRVHYFINDVKENGGLPSYTDIAPFKEGFIEQGVTITEIAPQIEGYVLANESWNSDRALLTYDKMNAVETWADTEFVKSIIFFYDKATSSVVEPPVDQPEEPAGATTSTDTSAASQPTNSQPTVEDRYDVVTLKYRDENGEDLGEDLMMVYPTSPQRITPPAIEGYEFKEASVGENYLMYSKPISLPYEHRFAQVLTEEDLHNHSNFLGGKIKEAQDSLRDGSAYTYILNYRKTSPSDQAPVEHTEKKNTTVEIAAYHSNGYLNQYQEVVPSGISKTYTAPAFDGWEVYAAGAYSTNFSWTVKGVDSVTLPEGFVEESVRVEFYYKPVETPAEKQVISSEVRILNVDGATYWKGEELDKAVVGTTTVELEVGGDLAIPATVVPEGYEITDVRFNALSTGVKELPHTWAYEEYKNYTSAPMSVPEIDILVKPVSKPVETSVSPQPAETSVVTPVDKPVETLVDTSVTKPLETQTETTVNKPAETPTNVQPSADQAGQSATEPTVLPKQDSQAGTASPTDQSAPGKQETEQETKEQAAPASQSKQATDKPAPTSQPQAKSLPATGDAHSVLHMTGMGLLGLAGLVVKRRSRKSY
ncbi:TPA: LPXTG cell wall anchor domain-containing protein [Streptococcus suis]